MKKTIKVCILTAGKGTRMGKLGAKLNKSLHAINGKAIISIIIQKFPSNSEFIIATGHLGFQVKAYLKIAHPKINFSFVDVKNYDGQGSGPGLSLLSCHDLLQDSFYFVSCDTLWSNNLNWEHSENWLGLAEIEPSETENYCNAKIDKNNIIDLIDKKLVDDQAYKAFVGLCYIKDYKPFWKGIKKGHLEAGEHQISSGLRQLITESRLSYQMIDWEDVGDETKFKKTASKYENFDFSKDDEVLYIINKKVIKFFSNPKIAEQRVHKSRLNQSVFPKITHFEKQFYSYSFLEGETLYKNNDEIIFTRLLKWLDKSLWIDVSCDKIEIKKACKIFYRDKTFERISLYKKKYPTISNQKKINNIEVPNLQELLKKIPWEFLFEGKKSFFHGDLQFDNIIYNKSTKNFHLIDWRQDFAGNINFGDVYYDLAKLYGGIILNYDYIKLNLFSFKENEVSINFDFAQRYSTNVYLKILADFVNKKKLNLNKIKILVGLIYLNMAPLHKYPFDKMLYSLGKLTLDRELSKKL